jgi:uncharacterized paraquat-inducible protein A
MNKLVEIAKAWIAAANPTEEQRVLAEKRAAVCQSCDYSRHNETLDLHYCGNCGCPLSKKIFSPEENDVACEKGFWANIK